MPNVDCLFFLEVSFLIATHVTARLHIVVVGRLVAAVHVVCALIATGCLVVAGILTTGVLIAAAEDGRDALTVAEEVKQAEHGPSDYGKEGESDSRLDRVHTGMDTHVVLGLSPCARHVQKANEPHDRPGSREAHVDNDGSFARLHVAEVVEARVNDQEAHGE